MERLNATVKNCLAASGFIFIPYGQWDYARMELALGSKVCIVATRKQARAAKEKAPIPIGLDRDGAIVRVCGEDQYSAVHARLCNILRNGLP